jgi:hypothetical protein
MWKYCINISSLFRCFCSKTRDNKNEDITEESDRITVISWRDFPETVETFSSEEYDRSIDSAQIAYNRESLKQHLLKK